MARTKQTKRKRERRRRPKGRPLQPHETDPEPTDGLAQPNEKQDKPAADADRRHPGVQDGGVNKKRRRRDRRDRPPRPADAADSMYGIYIRQNVKNFKVDEISVKVADGFITIEGQRQDVGDDEDPNTVRRSFNHRHRLPYGLDPESLTSTLSSDGIIIVTAPKFAVPCKILTIVETGEPAPPLPEPLPVINEVKTETPQAPQTEAVNNGANENNTAPA